MRIKGKEEQQMIVLISGGSSGIGKAAAERFVMGGHTVYELSRSGADREGIRHLRADVSKRDEVFAAVELLIELEGRVDVLLSNAGFGISGAFEECSEAAVRKQFDVNLFGAIHLIQAILPHMRKAGRGRILITSSLAGEIAIPFQSFYAASKAALNSLCLSLDNELRPFGISCSALIPGDIRTGFTEAREKTASTVYQAEAASLARMEKDERQGASPKQVAEKLYRMAVSRRRPRPLTTLGANYFLLYLLYRLLPRSFGNWLVGKIYAPQHSN